MVILGLLLDQETHFDPSEVMTDTTAYPDVVFGLFWVLGYRFSPRLADIGGARFWRIERSADYGAFNRLSRIAGSKRPRAMPISRTTRSRSLLNGSPSALRRIYCRPFDFVGTRAPLARRPRSVEPPDPRSTASVYAYFAEMAEAPAYCALGTGLLRVKVEPEPVRKGHRLESLSIGQPRPPRRLDEPGRCARRP